MDDHLRKLVCGLGANCGTFQEQLSSNIYLEDDVEGFQDRSLVREARPYDIGLTNSLFDSINND